MKPLEEKYAQISEFSTFTHHRRGVGRLFQMLAARPPHPCSAMPMPAPTRAGLLELPDSALKKVAKSVIGLGADGVFTPGQGQGLRAVTLARTCRRLRLAAAAPIRVVRFEARGAWPALKALGPHVWDELEELDCVVGRSSLLGFLKWLLPARGLKALKLRVIGAPYGAEKLSAPERMLLGRLFAQIGSGLVELQVSGIDAKAVLRVVLFQCSELRVIDFGHHAEAGMGTSPRRYSTFSRSSVSLTASILSGPSSPTRRGPRAWISHETERRCLRGWRWCGARYGARYGALTAQG